MIVLPQHLGINEKTTTLFFGCFPQEFLSRGTWKWQFPTILFCCLGLSSTTPPFHKISAKALGRNPDRTSLSWWFEPISKIWVKMDHFPKFSGWTWKNICLNHHLDQVDGSEIPNSQPPTWDGAFEPTLAAGFLNLLTLMVQKTTGFKPPIFFQMKRFWRVQNFPWKSTGIEWLECFLRWWTSQSDQISSPI